MSDIDARHEDEWTTQMRGRHEDEYQIYLSCTDDSPPKSFDEWFES